MGITHEPPPAPRRGLLRSAARRVGVLVAAAMLALLLDAVRITDILPAAGAQAPTSPLPVQVPRTGPQRVDALEAELVADVARAVPGESFRLGLRLAHDPHWHTYWRNPGDSGLPTQFDPTVPAGTVLGPIDWPMPQRIAVGPLANFGYEGEVVLSRAVSLPTSFSGSVARFEVLAQWLVCKDVCIPGEAALALDVRVGPSAVPADGPVVALFADSISRSPKSATALEAGWWQQGTEAVLTVPPSLSPSRAEFFPYFEGVVSPPAPQTLVAAGNGRQLRLVTVPGATGAQPSAGLPEPAGGLLIADGKPVEVRLRSAAAAPATGPVLSVAEATRPAAETGRAGGGLLDRLSGRGPTAPAASSARPAGADATAEGFGGTLAVAIVAALVGGLILNLMPCVFPVIGLKVLSFARAAGGDPRIARHHAGVFSLGVVVTFLLLGGLMIALRSVGDAVGWGFQMQSPLFVAAMALLFVLLGLNLSGVFETGLAMTRIAAPGPVSPTGGTERLSASFWTGVIAVVVATPCTAPFMGSAIGFTLTSPPLQTMAVFAALGVGMAAPYLLLGSSAGLMRWLPKPGAWLQTFKQFLAFPMFATAAWLAWVLTLQTGADGLLMLLIAVVLIAMVAWIDGRRQAAPSSAGRAAGLMWLATAVVAGAVGLWLLLRIDGLDASIARGTDPSALPEVQGGQPATGATGGAAVWEPWSETRVAQALDDGRIVFVDFTAAWCISCQANKKLVLERDAVARAFRAQRVVLLRADWTRRDPAITAELARHGRNGVPLYLVHTPGSSAPRTLPELLTMDGVLSAIGAPL